MNEDVSKVQLFVTCLVDNFYPDVGFSVVEFNSISTDLALGLVKSIAWKMGSR